MEEEDGEGGKHRAKRARGEQKRTPLGAPISLLLSKIYMRHCVLGWKTLGHARCCGAEIAHHADEFVVCGRVPAEAMRAVVERMMECLRLPVNVRKTHCARAPEEPLGLLESRVGCSYRRTTGEAYLGTRPSAGSVRSICGRINELTQARQTAGRGRDRGSLEPSVARPGELLPPRPDRSGLPSDRRVRDEAAAPAAVSEAQGPYREGRALPRRAPMGSHGTHAPGRADGQPCVGEGNDLERERSAGNPHAGFDERGEEA